MRRTLDRVVATAAIALAVALVVLAAGCTPASRSLFDSWRARLEVVPSSEVIESGIIQPGTRVPPGHTVLISGISIRQVKIMRLPKRGAWLEILLDNEARQRFAEITGRGQGEQLLFVVDNVVLSAPTIGQPIETGHFAVPLDYATPTPGSPPPPILPAP